ncbi:protein lin-28 homolog [Chironomus tepperi]|uniref:protein lin-28 homolog n=1 Tax=Chironomus tepperi TaxID=113505 RepID=UPI00391F5435
MATEPTTKSSTVDEKSENVQSEAKDSTLKADEEIIGMRRGKCKWFNVLKGFGFIVPDDGSQEVFVHQSVIKMGGFRSLGENEAVEFECKRSGKGLEATRVSGPSESECKGSTFKPKPKKRFRKVRCYNCGEFANHLANECSQGSLPKRCHHCKKEDHLVADCPEKPEKAKRTSKSDADKSLESTSNE